GNGRLDTHSRGAPGRRLPSVMRPAAVRTRNHVSSVALATRRYGATAGPVVAGGGTMGAWGGLTVIDDAGGKTSVSDALRRTRADGSPTGGSSRFGRTDATRSLTASGEPAGWSARRSAGDSRPDWSAMVTATRARPSPTSKMKLTKTALRLRPRGSCSTASARCRTGATAGVADGARLWS